MNKSKNIFKTGIVALAAFMITLFAFAYTPQSGEAYAAMVDYCLDDNGNIRQGVDIIGRFTKGGTEYIVGKDQTPTSVNADFGDMFNHATPSTILDGKHGGFYGGFGWGWGSIDGGTSYIQLDLGAVRDVNEIGFAPITHGDDYWRRHRIIVSNDKDFSTYTEICNFMVFDGEKIFAFSDEETKHFRYLRIFTNSAADILAAGRKLTVKGYCDDLFEGWRVPEVTGGGEYTVSIPVTHFNGAKQYSMQLAAYDADGRLTAFSNTRVEAQAGVLSASINVPDGTKSLRAMLVNDAGEVVYAVDPSENKAEIYTNEPVTLSGKNFAEFEVNENIININALGEPEDNITLYVLKDVDKTKTAEEYFNEVGEDLNGKMYFTAVGKSKEGIKFSVPFDETGLYYFRVVKSDTNSSESAYYRFSMVTDDKKDEFVSKVFATDGSDWDDITAEYVDNLELLTDSNIFSVEEIKQEGFTDVLVKTRDMMFDDEPKALEDVNSLVNSAIIVSRFLNGNYISAGEDINSCPELLDFIGEYSSYDRFVEVLKKILVKDMTSSELEQVLTQSAMLSFIQGGTAQEVADMLEKHGSVFGIDVADCAKNGVELARVAKRLDTSNAAAYYGDSLKAAFDAAVLAEKKYIADTEATKKPTGGSGGGGGGGSIIYAPIKKPTTEPEPGQKPTAPTVPEGEAAINTVFSDLDGYDWAKENIKRLSDKGVLNGYSDGTYKPAAGVSRAEFVKMLVTSLEITVNEKEEMRFADCTGNDWFYPYVAIAYSVGCVSGIDEYTFNASGSITRQDLAVMLFNALEHKGKPFAMTEEVCTEPLPDYAKEAFNALIGKGIITGYDDGTYKPAGHVTRAEAAVMLCRVIDLIDGGTN